VDGGWVGLLVDWTKGWVDGGSLGLPVDLAEGWVVGKDESIAVEGLEVGAEDTWNDCWVEDN